MNTLPTTAQSQQVSPPPRITPISNEQCEFMDSIIHRIKNDPNHDQRIADKLTREEMQMLSRIGSLA